MEKVSLPSPTLPLQHQKNIIWSLLSFNSLATQRLNINANLTKSAKKTAENIEGEKGDERGMGKERQREREKKEPQSQKWVPSRFAYRKQLNVLFLLLFLLLGSLLRQRSLQRMLPQRGILGSRESEREGKRERERVGKRARVKLRMRTGKWQVRQRQRQRRQGQLPRGSNARSCECD